MRPARFRTKLFLAMMAVVTGLVAAVLGLTQNRVESAYSTLYQSRFTEQNRHWKELRSLRIQDAVDAGETLQGNVRLQALMRRLSRDIEDGIDLDEIDSVVAKLYQVADAELRFMALDDLLFYRILHSEAGILSPPENSDARKLPDSQEDRLRRQLGGNPATQVRAQEDESGDRTGLTTLAPDGETRLLTEVIRTPITDLLSGERPGALVIGLTSSFSAHRAPENRETTPSESVLGVWIEGNFFCPSLTSADAGELSRHIGNLIPKSRREGRLEMHWDGAPHRMYYAQLDSAEGLPPAYRISLFSLGPMLGELRELRWRIGGIGAVGLVAALAICLILAHGLSGPIRDLVRATLEIQAGHLNVRVPVRSTDEMGQLAESFNAMSADLALKDKYRHVLDVIADKDVAEELLDGKLQLGGEIREISVLFCDIRGFTALTENMAPEEVIHMLNRHFTPLTEIVNRHHGVVDKYVGDLIMAIFGAPRGYGDDTRNACACALAMIRERNHLNQSELPIEMGIGLATGPAVAGCMGSGSRLNYTVLGERVNLASRLCGQADSMKVVIDQTTRARLEATADVTPLPRLNLKGFSEPVPAYELNRLLEDTSPPAPRSETKAALIP